MTNPWAKPYQDLREAITPYRDEDLFTGQKIDPKTGKPVKPILNISSQNSVNVPSYGTVKPSTDAFTGDASIKSQPSTTTTTTPIKPIPSTASSATASTAEKIKGGMSVYQSQIKSGDIKGAEQTGKDISTLKYGTPEERKAKTIGTRNPLMDRTFGYQTGQAPDQKPSMGPTQTVTAKSSLPGGDYSAAATSKMSQRARNILGTNVKIESKEVIHDFLVREGYVAEEKPKRWWDDDGDGVGYEPGEVKGKFKKKKKK